MIKCGFLQTGLILTIEEFAAHLEKFDGTLVRRGTSVEKHRLTEYFVQNFQILS
jgi:hypothetical protein